MYPEGAQVQPPVQTVCLGLSHLFLLVHTYADLYLRLRKLRSHLLAGTRFASSNPNAGKDVTESLVELKRMQEETAEEEPRLRSQICE